MSAEEAPPAASNNDDAPGLSKGGRSRIEADGDGEARAEGEGSDSALEVKSGESEIHHYAQAGDVEEVRRCLLAGCSKVDEVDELGCTPVHLAGAMGYTNVVKLLVEEHGAAVDAKDGAFCTALHAASEGGHPVVVELLIRLGAEMDARNRKLQTPLHYACGYGQVEAAEQLAFRGASPAARDIQGNTPLHLACGGGGADVVRMLLAHGSSLNAVNHRGRRPLHIACRSGNLEIAKVLLEHGADPSAKDSNGMQAIEMIGAKRSVPQAVRFELIDVLERYQLGEYAMIRPPVSATSSLRQMWKERDESARQSTHSGEGSTSQPGSASRRGSSVDGFSVGSARGLGTGGVILTAPAGGDDLTGHVVGLGGGGMGGDGERAVRDGRSPRWTLGAAVAGRLEEMRARELGASLRAKVQENEAMKRYLDSVKEEMRMLQQKVCDHSLAHSTPSPSVNSAAAAGFGAGTSPGIGSGTDDEMMRNGTMVGASSGSIAERVARSMYGNEGIVGRQSQFIMENPSASLQAVRRAVEDSAVPVSVPVPTTATMVVTDPRESVGGAEEAGGGGRGPRAADGTDSGVAERTTGQIVSNGNGALEAVAPSHESAKKIILNAQGSGEVEERTGGLDSLGGQIGDVGPASMSMSELLMAKRAQLQSLLDTQQARS